MSDEFEPAGLIADLTHERIEAYVRHGRALQSAAIRDSIRGLARSLWFTGKRDYTPPAPSTKTLPV